MVAWDVFSFVDLQTCVIAVVVFLLVYFLFISTSHELPPGPRGWPILGNVLDLKKYGSKGYLFYRDMQRKYGDVFRMRFGKHPMVVVNGYDAVHEVLVTQGTFLSHRPVWLSMSTTKDGKGIIWNEGKEWLELKRMTLRAFRDLGVGKTTLEERIEEEADCLSDVFCHNEAHPYQVRVDLSRGVANVIYSIVFGSRFDYEDPTFQHLTQSIDKLFSSQTYFAAAGALPFLRFIPTFKKQMQPYFDGIKTMREYIETQIQAHRETYTEDMERDYLDIFLKKESEDSSIFTVGNMTKCVLDLVLAGQETTASTLDFALLYMIKYPDVQHKCQKEIDKVVGAARRVKLSDRSALLYTEATIMEIQRMSSVAAFAILRTNYQDTWIGGYRIPRGSLINTNIYSVLHDEGRWGDPHIFRPERFISPHRELIVPEHWIPFGGGPRMCIGEILARMELFIFFTTLLQRFHFSKADDSEPDIEPVYGLTMKAKPYNLVLHVRC